MSQQRSTRANLSRRRATNPPQSPVFPLSPSVSVLNIPQPADSPIPPAYGVFEAHFNNRKRRRRGAAFEYFDVCGALFPDGRVVLNTNRLPRTGFTSLSACREYLESVGDVRLVWLALPCEASR